MCGAEAGLCGGARLRRRERGAELLDVLPPALLKDGDELGEELLLVLLVVGRLTRHTSPERREQKAARPMSLLVKGLSPEPAHGRVHLLEQRALRLRHVSGEHRLEATHAASMGGGKQRALGDAARAAGGGAP